MTKFWEPDQQSLTPSTAAYSREALGDLPNHRSLVPSSLRWIIAQKRGAVKGKPGLNRSLHTAWCLSSLSLPTKQGDIGGGGNAFCLQCRINMTRNQTVNPKLQGSLRDCFTTPFLEYLNSQTASSLSKTKYGLKHK